MSKCDEVFSLHFGASSEDKLSVLCPKIGPDCFVAYCPPSSLSAFHLWKATLDFTLPLACGQLFSSLVIYVLMSEHFVLV